MEGSMIFLKLQMETRSIIFQKPQPEITSHPFESIPVQRMRGIFFYASAL